MVKLTLTVSVEDPCLQVEPRICSKARSPSRVSHVYLSESEGGQITRPLRSSTGGFGCSGAELGRTMTQQTQRRVPNSRGVITLLHSRGSERTARGEDPADTASQLNRVVRVRVDQIPASCRDIALIV